jgi:hypothetical protein
MKMKENGVIEESRIETQWHQWRKRKSIGENGIWRNGVISKMALAKKKISKLSWSKLIEISMAYQQWRKEMKRKRK